MSNFFWIKAEINQGMFSQERVVGLNDINGELVSFFTDVSFTGEGCVKGEILEQDSTRAFIRFRGNDGITNAAVALNQILGASGE